MTAGPHTLEPSPEVMRSLARLATERIVEHIASLPERPSLDVEGGRELAEALAEGPPATGAAAEELLELIFERATPTSFNNPGPGFLAYIPGGGLFESALADFIAGAINRYVTVWTAAPGLVQLETNVIRWFCSMLGYPSGSGGFLASGGSLANFSAIFTARRERLPENFLDGTIYASNQVHHCVGKAATLAGFPDSALRVVSVDADYRIDLSSLERTIASDRSRGKKPFLLVGSVGTTNTGAVDDLEALAELAERERLWLHLDAAYGGFFALTARGQARMTGIERADSITLDPHKGLFLPYGTGCLLVRDVGTLKRAHTVRADYMPPMQDSEELVDYCEISPELSRDFRGLRVWLPLKMYGFEAFERALDEKLDLTAWLEGELRALEGIELVAEAQLSVIAFRLSPPGVDEAGLDRLNRDFLRRINSRKRVFLTETVLEDRFVIRVCVLNFRTHRDRMQMCLEDIRDAAVEALAARESDAPWGSIRRAEAADARAVADLGARSFRDAFADQNTAEDMRSYLELNFSIEGVRDELEDPANIFLLAQGESGREPIGYAKLARGTADAAVRGPAPIELERLYVDKAWLGKGIGSALMRACLEEAVRQGRRTVWLGVWEQNPRAIAFYERWGFAPVGTHVFRLGSADQTDLIMERGTGDQRSLSDQS